MTAPRVLCVGALTMDTNYLVPAMPSGSGKVLASEVQAVAAGMASSAAIAAARLGGNVELWASVGDDVSGEFLHEAMRTHGVGSRLIRQVTGSGSASAVIVVDAQGERMVVAHYPSALLSPPTSIPVIAGVFDAVLVDTRWPAAAEVALRGANTDGVPGVLDLDVADPDLVSHLVPLASHVVASAAGATMLTGTDDTERALGRLTGMSGRFASITLGPDGCIWTDSPGAPIHHQPAPRVAVVDTNAAGDVFHGAFALALAEGQAEVGAVGFSSAAAALKCTRFGGASGAPTRAELDAFLARPGKVSA